MRSGNVRLAEGKINTSLVRDSCTSPAYFDYNCTIRLDVDEQYDVGAKERLTVRSLGIFAGVLVLGVYNFGVLGRLCAEVVENLDRQPIQAIRAIEANRGKTLLYSVLPTALPPFLT